MGALQNPQVDLHLHSTCSDGEFPVDALVARCAMHRLTTIAITDHDTIDHVPLAQEAGRRHGIHVIAGTEISVQHDGLLLHLLGFRFDSTHPRLRAEIQGQADALEQGMRAAAEHLVLFGYSIDTRLFRAKTTGAFGHKEFAKAVVDNPANATRLREDGIVDCSGFIHQYLAAGKPAHIERRRMSMKEGIDLLHEAGGLAVWAHAPWSLRPCPDRLESLVASFSRAGIDGLEVFYPTHDRPTTRHLHRLCERHGLFATAGSDFHRLGQHPFSEVGSWDSFGLPWTLDPRLVDE